MAGVRLSLGLWVLSFVVGTRLFQECCERGFLYPVGREFGVVYLYLIGIGAVGGADSPRGCDRAFGVCGRTGIRWTH
jgi:hypothetical protein